MGIAIATGEALALAVENAGELPGITRDRKSEPVPADIVQAFVNLPEGRYVRLATVPADSREDVNDAVALVARFNRAATRDGQRADGMVFVLRTLDDETDGKLKAIYVGRDIERVRALDAQQAERDRKRQEASAE